MPIQLATSPASIARCFEVLRELRPSLESEADLVAKVQQKQSEGFQLAFLEHEEEVVTVAGFRVMHMLVSGLTLYVDDLVTGEQFRSQGHGKTMLDWLIAHARERGCQHFSLDSGTHRQSAHAFYFREGMRISSFHFVLPLKP
ncbi:GNAT family N-acetyltransferase [Granulicella sp. S156]|jgi:GNAT superfamily N-acetyltransferase|uniref:GNAT family N-acetyltransferase n=1 Tax=Granulicella sp. S156 TaxID=1747224 RepID=UPI00131DDCDC|nr:GNAT family N-acetyltransferase [Granulicella sp. S156]